MRQVNERNRIGQERVNSLRQGSVKRNDMGKTCAWLHPAWVKIKMCVCLYGDSRNVRGHVGGVPGEREGWNTWGKGGAEFPCIAKGGMPGERARQATGGPPTPTRATQAPRQHTGKTPHPAPAPSHLRAKVLLNLEPDPNPKPDPEPKPAPKRSHHQQQHHQQHHPTQPPTPQTQRRQPKQHRPNQD